MLSRSAILLPSQRRLASVSTTVRNNITSRHTVPFLCNISPFSSSTTDNSNTSTGTTTTQGNASAVKFNRVYTHPLSQVVLEHLQKVHGSWLMRKGLDQLTLNRDGTFVLRFPAEYPGDDSGRIWTSYDSSKKQHWISVYKHELLGRYPLHTGEGEWACMMEKMQMRQTIDRMVERISVEDRKSQAGHGYV